MSANEDLLNDDPDIETIVGKENVVDLGDTIEAVIDGQFADNVDSLDEERRAGSGGYKCADCSFTSKFLSEIEEHCNGTKHGGFKNEEPVKPEQPQLFSEKGVIHRDVQVPLAPEFLSEKRVQLATLYQNILDVEDAKSAAVSDFNAQIKSIDAQMQEIARVLKLPYTHEKVDCEWRILEAENARGLYRLDTGEMIEKQPLTAEDRAAELERAQEANATPAEGEKPVEPHDDSPAAEGAFINERNSGRRRTRAQMETRTGPDDDESEEESDDEPGDRDTEAAAVIAGSMTESETPRKDPLANEGVGRKNGRRRK